MSTIPNTLGLPREWQVPGIGASEDRKLGWLREATEQGALWIQSQRGFKDWRASLDVISGEEDPRDVLSYRSRISGRRLKTNIRTAIAGLANIRPIWGFHATKSFASYAQVLNKTSWALYLENYWDQSIKEALAYSSATCTGFVQPVYSRNLQGRGNLELRTYGMPCVLPIQMPANGDYQRAYAVNLLDELPIYEAHWKFPLFQDRLRPTTSRLWYSRQIRKAAEQNAMKRMLSWFRRRDEDKLVDQYIPIRWTTINDLTLNDSGHTIPMGEPGSSWYYEVPTMGSEIPDGAGGKRKADENDCRLYPQRRLIASSEDCVMYDGPAFNWHGQLDLIPFYLDRWPWEPMGFSMVHDGAALQSALDDIDRSAMNKLKAQQDPPLGYPMGGVTQPEAESFDPLEPRTRIGYDEQAVDQPFKLAVPYEVLQIGPEALKMREIYQDELDYQLQTRDIAEMAKARALSKNLDSMEALIKSYGPIVQDIARSMEKSLGMLGNQMRYLIPQYMTTSRLMQYNDPETMSMDVWDFDPSNLVPSHMPGEVPFDKETQRPIPSQYTLMQRAKMFANNVRFFLMPHSVHEVTQMSFRLGLMQLRGRGYPISAATVMDSWDIQNVAKPEGNTEQERFWSEKEEEITKMARLQKIVESLGIQPMNMGGPKKPGRPNSDKAAPHQETKSDGRPVVSTS